MYLLIYITKLISNPIYYHKNDCHHLYFSPSIPPFITHTLCVPAYHLLIQFGLY